MKNKLASIVQSHRKLSIAIGVIALVVIILLVGNVITGGGWTKGGEETSAPFRYRVSARNTVIVRVSTENLDADKFAILTDDSEQLQSKLKGTKGTELVYKIDVSSDTNRATWGLGYYLSDEDKANGKTSYVLLIDITRGDNNKLSVSADVGEEAAEQMISTDDYEMTYQLEGNRASIELTRPQDINWQTEYDDQVISVEDFFMDEGITTATIRGVATGEWETTLIIYDYHVNAEGKESRSPEIRLLIKGTDNEISEIKQADD